MPSKMVIRQHDQTASIGVVALKNADSLAAKLTERLMSHSQQAQPPEMDWKTVLVDLGQFLVDTGDGLIGKDQDLQQQRRLERQLRFDRDAAALVIRAQLRSMRFLVDEAFGMEKSKQIFSARGDLQRLEAKVLLRVAQEAVEILKGNDYVWPDLSSLSYLATPAQILGALEPAVPKLATALEGLRPEKAGAKHALGNKNRDYRATVDVMRRGADLLFGLLRYAGLDEEADALRPSRRRKKAPAGNEEMPAPAPVVTLVPLKPSVGFPPPAVTA